MNEYSLAKVQLIKKASSVFDGVDADELMNELGGREVYA